MILRPCLHCPRREGCPIKADILDRARVAGLKLASATFRCAERLRGLEVGRRVRVTLYETFMDSLGNDRQECDPILGTVQKHLPGGKLAIWLDLPSSRGKVRIRLYPDYPGIEALEEIEPVCRECARPASGYRQPDGVWLCDTCGSPYDAEDEGHPLDLTDTELAGERGYEGDLW